MDKTQLKYDSEMQKYINIDFVQLQGNQVS